MRAQREWRSAMHAAAAQALEFPLKQVVLKRRHGQRPDAQYRKLGPSGEDFIVGEGGHRFIVNLTDYLDTGLFLDHRQTRALVQRLAARGRFLNLFCYTGSFSVYAAGGGAKTSASVDLSKTYLDWARRNFELNGMDAGRHRLVRADARQFVQDEAAAGQRYDLVVLDPPSFSNSKRMHGVLDVQRDHVALIRDCAEILAPAGELLFSTNLRSFRLDAGALAGLNIADTSAQTVPPDFRNKKIHKCWRICRDEGRDTRAEGRGARAE
jgi:23S rRNA (cytosine1962-C5)-methyltransferase